MRRELPPWAGLAMMSWLTLVLWLDRVGGGGGHWQQRGLGVLTWAVLAVALSRVSPTVRVQTLVVVAFATTIEYVFSPTLGVYTYRFHNVPAYVPPGHGLVYLSAFALGHALLLDRHRRTAVRLVLVAGGAWASYGVLVAQRTDALGAFWFACLAVFLLRGPSQAVYIGAFVAVSWLELVGTHLGTWVWSTHDPTGAIPIGNPPSGAAGGYGWFDLAGLLAAPPLLRLLGVLGRLRALPVLPVLPVLPTLSPRRRLTARPAADPALQGLPDPPVLPAPEGRPQPVDVH